MAHTCYLIDGSFDWSDGVDSSKVTTVQSNMNPNGLRRNQLAWLNNATVRGGGITQRAGWIKNGDLHDGSAFYQGGFMYEPIDGSSPYLVVSIGGHIIKYDLDSKAVTDLSTQFGLFNPDAVEQAFFCQGEEFLVIQAGDGVTNPLFWDGSALRRSAGFGAPAQFGFWVTENWTPVVGFSVVLTTDRAYTGNIGDVIICAAPTVISGAPPNEIVVSYDPNFIVSGRVTAIDSDPAGGYHCTIAVMTVLSGSGSTFLANQFNFIKPNTFELPPATCMDYYMGRIWYAQGRIYGAGDIVGGASGTAAYHLRDSILKVTENPLCLGGDNFAVPTNAGTIRALKHTANINSDLGVSELYIATRKAIYSLSVPVTRDSWIAANANNMPLQRIVQLTNGWVNDRSVVPVNGDLFGQSLEPTIRSIKMALRNFNDWGNLPISNNEERALAINDRSLMRFATGITFDNRLYEAILPRRLPQGIVHDGVLPLDFDITSSLQNQLPPAWEGMLEGQAILEMFTGDFGGLEKAFVATVSSVDSSIDVWELTKAERFDQSDTRVVWSAEFPAFTWGKEFELKELMGGELWISRVSGTVDFKIEYRVDSDPCWRIWHYQEICVARSCAEDGPSCPTVVYPEPDRDYREGYKWTLTLPKPRANCDSMGVRPTTIGYQFQIRVTIRGFCQIRGLILYASPTDKSIYGGLTCG